jgi:hypothetical protein
VLVAFGLVVGAVLAGIFVVGAALASRRRAGGSSVYGAVASDGREAEGHCVELGGDAYTVRVVEEAKPPASTEAESSSPGK